MKRADRDGHCRVYMADGGGSYVLTRDHYRPLLEAWMAGRTFYTGSDHFGAPVTIKLARVEGVADNSAAVCAQAIAEDEQDRRERAIRGED
jgi:hypothetical protein